MNNVHAIACSDSRVIPSSEAASFQSSLESFMNSSTTLSFIKNNKILKDGLFSSNMEFLESSQVESSGRLFVVVGNAAQKTLNDSLQNQGFVDAVNYGFFRELQLSLEEARAKGEISDFTMGVTYSSVSFDISCLNCSDKILLKKNLTKLIDSLKEKWISVIDALPGFKEVRETGELRAMSNLENWFTFGVHEEHSLASVLARNRRGDANKDERAIFNELNQKFNEMRELLDVVSRNEELQKIGALSLFGPIGSMTEPIYVFSSRLFSVLRKTKLPRVESNDFVERASGQTVESNYLSAVMHNLNNEFNSEVTLEVVSKLIKLYRISQVFSPPLPVQAPKADVTGLGRHIRLDIEGAGALDAKYQLIAVIMANNVRQAIQNSIESFEYVTKLFDNKVSKIENKAKSFFGSQVSIMRSGDDIKLYLGHHPADSTVRQFLLEIKSITSNSETSKLRNVFLNLNETQIQSVARQSLDEKVEALQKILTRFIKKEKLPESYIISTIRNNSFLGHSSFAIEVELISITTDSWNQNDKSRLKDMLMNEAKEELGQNFLRQVHISYSGFNG